MTQDAVLDWLIAGKVGISSKCMGCPGGDKSAAKVVNGIYATAHRQDG